MSAIPGFWQSWGEFNMMRDLKTLNDLKRLWNWLRRRGSEATDAGGKMR